MDVLFDQGALFEGFDDEGMKRLCDIATRRTVDTDKYLFLLGDNADQFFVLTKGKVDLCFPMPIGGVVKDVAVESVGIGQALGWSALVKPYRFTLSARATRPSEVVGFSRRDLLDLFEARPATGCAFFTKISEIVGLRLLTFQALWMRELQRTLETEAQRKKGASQQTSA
jgi:CRP-like cAMP-binding protein